MGVLTTLSERTVPVTPGSDATVSIVVRNSGTVVDEISIAVLGDGTAWSTAEPPTVSLLPGSEATVVVRFRPPRNSKVAAGSIPFAVHARSKEDPDGSAVEEGTLELGSFSDATAELAPRTSRGRRSARHDLAIDNRGNSVLNATIEGEDAEKNLTFRVDPPSVVADPGTAVFAKIGVRARKRFWRGPSRSHQFRISVLGAGQTPLTADGTLLQEQMLPRWLGRAIALLLFLLVMAMVLWFLLLRPSIDNLIAGTLEDKYHLTPAPAADGNTGDDGSKTGASPSAGAGASPSLGTGNGASPSPSAGPSATPAIASPSPAGSPAGGSNGAAASRDGRLIVDIAPQAKPADGRALFVTDLVFSNADPEATIDGVLQLKRNAEVLLELRLADFRDLDFHFVTPIAIGDGEVLTLACQSGDCTGAAVYFSGYER